jgi:transcriptional regulator with XRE-family HTH domain
MLGQRPRLARKGAGLSLRGLAARIGALVTARALGKYERGEMLPSSAVLIRLSAALGVPAGAFSAGPGLDRVLLQVALEAFRAGALRSEVGHEALVARREGRHGLGEGVDRDLAGERVLVEHAQEDEHLVALRHGCRFELVEEGAVALEGALLLGFETSEARDEAEPAPVGGSGRPRVVAGPPGGPSSPGRDP